MELHIEQLEQNISRVRPVGRLDSDGSAAIKDQLTSMADAGRRIIVELTEVDYISSIGIRTLIMASQSAGSSGGKLVLMSPRPAVADVLHTARISYIIPVCGDLTQATRAVLG